MKVFLLQNIEKVGLKHEIIKVSDGYAKNFLFPQKKAIEITPLNEKEYEAKARKVQNRSEIIESVSSLLADQIGQITVKLKKKMHDNDKLYAAVSQHEVADALKEQHNITIGKSQVIFGKSIKSKGTFEVTIKLTSKIQPILKVQVIA